MWDLPRPGLEPLSPALAGRLSTTAPPGKPLCTIFVSEIRLYFKKCILSLNLSKILNKLFLIFPLESYIENIMNVSALQLKSTGEHTCGKLSLLLVTTVENPAHHRKLGASQ